MLLLGALHVRGDAGADRERAFHGRLHVARPSAAGHVHDLLDAPHARASRGRSALPGKATQRAAAPPGRGAGGAARRAASFSSGQRLPRQLPRQRHALHSTGAGSFTRTLDVTAYCGAGTTASGAPTREGSAATLDRGIPFGSQAVTPFGTFVITDRIGHGSDLDLFMSSCARAREFARRRVSVTFEVSR